MWNSLNSRFGSQYLDGIPQKSIFSSLILAYTYAFITYNIMLNRRGNRRKFAEADRLPILARGRSIKNSLS
jgi:hypothetical protein